MEIFSNPRPSVFMVQEAILGHFEVKFLQSKYLIFSGEKINPSHVYGLSALLSSFLEKVYKLKLFWRKD